MPALALSVLLLLLAACVAPTDAPLAEADAPAAKPDAPASPLVVAELFTSEGCSSCPPADRLLAALTREAEASGAPLLTLSYHVDYWDRLGWADPFGSPVHSARQRAYAPTLDGRVYTPELVIGGTRALVGSRERAVRAALADARADAQPARVTLAPRADGAAVAVDYAVTGAPDGARVHLLLVQRSGRSDVRRGENRGRRLDHVNVVRDVQTREAGTGTGALTLPDGLGPADVFVAALVQPGRVGPVLGAARAEISAAPTAAGS